MAGMGAGLKSVYRPVARSLHLSVRTAESVGAWSSRGCVCSCTTTSPSHKKRFYSVFNSTDTVFALSSGHGKCGEKYYIIITSEPPEIPRTYLQWNLNMFGTSTCLGRGILS